MYNTLPEHLMDIFKPNNLTHQYNTRNQDAPRQPISKTQVYKNSFICKGPGLWSQMDNNMKLIENLKKFCCTFKDNAVESY